MEWERIPLSTAARIAVEGTLPLRESVLGGGDDYELLFTAPETAAGDLARISDRLGLPLTAVGRITKPDEERMGRKQGVRIVDGAGIEIPLPSGGYRHF